MSQSPEAMKVWAEARQAWHSRPLTHNENGSISLGHTAAAASVIEAALQKARDEEREAVVAHMEWWSSQGGDDEPGWLEALAGQIKSGEHRHSTSTR